MSLHLDLGGVAGVVDECTAYAASVSIPSMLSVQLTTGDGGKECENRDRGSSLEPGERQPPPSSLPEGHGMTSNESAASCTRCRSRRMRRRSCTLVLWAAKSMNCSSRCAVCLGIGWKAS